MLHRTRDLPDPPAEQTLISAIRAHISPNSAIVVGQGIHTQCRTAACSSLKRQEISALTGPCRGNARHFGRAAAPRRRTGQGSRGKTVGMGDHRADETSRRWCSSVPGLGPITAKAAIVATVGDPEAIQIRSTVRGLARPRAAATTVERRQGSDWEASASEETAISGGCWCTAARAIVGMAEAVGYAQNAMDRTAVGAARPAMWQPWPTPISLRTSPGRS